MNDGNEEHKPDEEHIEHVDGQNIENDMNNLFALTLPGGTDTFPVLKAFQDYLAAEREKARQRQMMLTYSFIGAIVVLILFGSIIFMTMSKNFTKVTEEQNIRIAKQQEDINDHQKTVISMLREAMQSSAQTERIVPAAAPANVPAPAVVAESVAAPSVAPETKPAVAAEPDPVMLEMVALLRKMNEERAAEKAQAEKVRKEEEARRKSGVISVVKPQTPPVAAVAPSVTPPVVVAPDSATTQPPAPTPVAEPVKPVAPNADEIVTRALEAPETVVPEARVSEQTWDAVKPLKISGRRVKNQRVPPGYVSEPIELVTEEGDLISWRILSPTGDAAAR